MTLLILEARKGFLKDKSGPRAKTFEHHCPTETNKRPIQLAQNKTIEMHL